MLATMAKLYVLLYRHILVTQRQSVHHAKVMTYRCLACSETHRISER